MDWKACGVIAEYNPFHLGHAYQLEQARQQSQAQVMVIAMSGNWVQRGEPALVDKFIRARAALLSGADLVLEVPTLGAVQASDFFARAGLEILSSAGCSSLSFGTEYAQAPFQEALDQLQRLNFRGRSRDLTYAKQVSNLAKETYSEDSALYQVLQSPNAQLGLAYARANQSLDRPLQLLPIQRKGRGHGDLNRMEGQYSSGTALRQALLDPKLGASALSELPYWPQQPPVLHKWETYWPYLEWALYGQTVDSLTKIYQMREGIEHRLVAMAKKADSFADWVQLVKNKRWTWVAIQRLALYCLLGVNQDDLQVDLPWHSQVKVLGFNQTGQKWLKQVSGGPVQMVTNYAQIKDKRQDRWDSLYHLPYGQKVPQFKPIVL